MLRHLLFVGAVALAVAGAAQADTVDQGQALYEQKCAVCHTLGGGDRIGPDLKGATERRPQAWLLKFVMTPERMIAEKDPVAIALFEQYNRIAMPNLGLTEDEAMSLLAYIEAASSGAAPTAGTTPAGPMPRPQLAAPQSAMLKLFIAFAIVIVAVFAWVALSTRSPVDVDTHRAYGLRRVFFIVASVAVLALLAATIPLAPYAGIQAKADRVVHVAARQFEFIFSDEPLIRAAEIGRLPVIRQLELSAGSVVEFRVTALDVSHGFGLYGPDRQIVAQVQAMPGYVNRLQVRFDEPGQYKVLCMEYCAAGHHLMQTGITVK